MKAKELAQELLKYPEFEVSFCFIEQNQEDNWPNLRRFEKIKIEDIGHFDQRIQLGGQET